MISTDPDTDARKASFRAKLKQRRAEAAAANGAAIAQLAAERFLAAIPVKAGQVVAGYWPMGDELDPRPLLQQLQRRGALIVLPVIQTGSRLLLFRLCKDLSQVPPAGAYGIPAPPEGSSPLQPDVLLVPLVGFDREGHRLGMGGGYYDTTLRALRRTRAAGAKLPLAVGYAFAVQQVAELPHGDGDEMLDWVVTERGAVAFGQNAKESE
ncbi:5-formyltetrahydrofolate cyclo-ligase [uncultured Ferrovibrio sp.]|uniref:5-formyltetrahydrofolate cyclo-ligase n=1 Tax=uncultured Ferrovibrio sp. TaxID=1576913 RepID=UPI002601CBAA|nr:5-formyltetrahydrofolate cyclo-ligase [uncultured Ferrovibrio sp.]